MALLALVMVLRRWRTLTARLYDRFRHRPDESFLVVGLIDGDPLHDSAHLDRPWRPEPGQGPGPIEILFRRFRTRTRFSRNEVTSRRCRTVQWPSKTYGGCDRSRPPSGGWWPAACSDTFYHLCEGELRRGRSSTTLVVVKSGRCPDVFRTLPRNQPTRRRSHETTSRPDWDEVSTGSNSRSVEPGRCPDVIGTKSRPARTRGRWNRDDVPT